MRVAPDHADMPNQPDELSQLTPRALEIYAEFKTVIENKRDSL
jgi:hypothetical protein